MAASATGQGRALHSLYKEALKKTGEKHPKASIHSF